MEEDFLDSYNRSPGCGRVNGATVVVVVVVVDVVVVVVVVTVSGEKKM